ncbi:MAG TPA: hypothetical protein VG106_16315, partial [Vicinamibacterales bacterium]|nr:hypothetical protein [Vicinamibacterales bacterium]
MKLWEIFRYDLATQLRRYTTPIYGLGLAVMALLAMSTFVDDAKRDGVFLNAPMATAASVIIATIVGMLVTAALTGEAGTRDVQARMEPLLYTTPLPKSTYLGGRFLSAFAAGALLLAFAPLALAAGRFVPGFDPSFFGPFDPASYLRAYVTVALPNAFIVTALLFSLVVLSRRAMAAFFAGAALFLNTLIQDEVVAGALGRWDLAKLFDPFAFIVARAQWRSWTVAQRNTLPLQLDDELLMNRLLWIGVSLAALALVHLRFRMAHYAPATRWPWRRRRVDAPLETTVALATPHVRGTFDRATRVRQAMAIALHAYRELIASRAAWFLPAIGLLLFKITPELMEVGLGTPGRPTTGRIVMLYGKFSTIGVFVGALIVFFAGQLVWRERDARENDVTDATPVPDAVTFAGKF